MQSVSGYPTDLEAVEPSALVTVNGKELSVSSLSVSRELASSMPAQTVATSGITAATGNVSWSVGKDIEARSSHPWDGKSFPPKPADNVVAFMGYGDVQVRQLTGVIDSTQGSIADGDVSSSLADPIDKLNRPVTFPPVMAVMPPHSEHGEFLHVGNEPTHTTDRVLRACGFYATPPRSTGSVVSVPLMGSAWPERGRVTRAGQQGSPSFPVSFNASHWGVATNSIDAEYAPELSFVQSGRLDRTLQITVKARRVTANSGNTVISAWWGDWRVAMVLTPSRRIRAHANGDWQSTTVCEFATNDVWSADTFMLRVTPDGNFTLYANNGATVTGTATVPSSAQNSDMTRVTITSPHITGMHIGGVQVNFGSTNVYNHTPTAVLTQSAYGLSLAASPRIDGRNALSVLKEQAEAECAAMWIDEQGRFRWVNHKRLVDSDPVGTLTALDDVLDIGWESSAQGVRSNVVITSQQALINRSDVPNQLAWQGSGGSLDSGQEKVEYAAPGNDVDWIGVDEVMSNVTTTGGWVDSFNWGHRSWTGAIYTDGDTELWAIQQNSGYSSNMEKDGPFAYKITTHAGSPPSGYSVEQRTRSQGGGANLVNRSKRDFNLPVLRAKAVVEWVERETEGASLGPENAASLEHSVGHWVQNTDALQELADWLSAQVSEPRPILRDLNVVPDFRRQLGDIVWVEDLENMRIRLKVLITKIDTSVSAGNADQSVGGRILEVQQVGATNEQLDEHASVYTNTGFDTLWSDATNTDLDDDPLGRG